MKQMMYIIEAQQLKDKTLENPNPCSIFAFEAETQEQRDAIYSRFYNTYSSMLINYDIEYGFVKLIGTSGNELEVKNVNHVEPAVVLTE